MRAVVVGAGASARELIRRLGDSWDVTVIDPDPERLMLAEKIRPMETVEGDGSSALVLRDADIAHAVTVVAATGFDDVNLEVTKLAKVAGVEHVVSVVRLPDRLDEFRALGAETVTPASLAGRDMEIAMEPRKLTSTTFADGRAEAIEFEITPDSPVQGRALKDIHSETWVVAAILRTGQLVVPHGATRLLTGDRVTVVGAAADFTQIVRTFAGGVSRFPLNFGRKVVVPLVTESDVDGVVAEAAQFVRNSNAVSLIVVHRDPRTVKSAADADVIEQLVEWTDREALGIEVEHRAVDADPSIAAVEIAKGESVGVIAVPMSRASARRPFAGIPKALNRSGTAGVPVLLTRGAMKFEAIVAPSRRTISGDSAARAAIDIAKRAGVKVVGVAVANPSFMGADDLMEKKHATAWLRQEASVQDVDVERHVVRGNPVRVLSDVNERDRLLVVSMPSLPVSRVNPGTAVWAASRGEGSVLFVPVVE
ncbi:MAG: TrkA family potassium uptake protein [Acidimicrobiia bacterium]|nr:TrkA family potassium uptake protein [Acidimicrobiia bacterium]